MKHNNKKGKVVIVAGGSGGIGSEIHRQLTILGAQTIVVSRNSSHSTKSQNEIARMSSNSIFLNKDLRLFEEWDELIETVLMKFERIDILINSVGIIIPGAFTNLTKSEIENYLNTNMLSIIYGARAVAPVMKKQKYGHIINIGSLGGIVPMPYETMYCATKFGIRGFSLSLAEELKKSGINVSLISPGTVKTKLLDLEATDDKSTISFVNKPYDPKTIAKVTLKLIQNPQSEVIIPSYIKQPSLIAGKNAKLFAGIYPLLNAIGRKGLKHYRKKYLNHLIINGKISLK
ncbi:SDR family NAD(P)-dependent oxidoreductase [Bacteroidota bacterium]